MKTKLRPYQVEVVKAVRRLLVARGSVVVDEAHHMRDVSRFAAPLPDALKGTVILVRATPERPGP